MKYTKLQYRILGGGDYSVGIPDVDAIITIEENVSKHYTEDIERWREFLAEYYDISKGCVFTIQEWNDMLEAEKEMEPEDEGHDYVITMKERF